MFSISPSSLLNALFLLSFFLFTGVLKIPGMFLSFMILFCFMISVFFPKDSSDSFFLLWEISSIKWEEEYKRFPCSLHPWPYVFNPPPHLDCLEANPSFHIISSINIPVNFSLKYKDY